MNALLMLLAAMWNSLKADAWTFWRMVVTACSYPDAVLNDWGAS